MKQKKFHLKQKTTAKNAARAAARAMAVVMIHFQSIGLRKSGFSSIVRTEETKSCRG